MSQPTVLLPIDPAVSPEQIYRVLPIRANLLPPEIMASRNSRRIRVGLVVTVVVVAAAMVSWFVVAVAKKSEAERNLATVTEQVGAATKRKQQHQGITDLVEQKDQINEKLSTLMANDLPWSTMLDTIRATGAANGASVDSISGTLTAGTNTTTTTSMAAGLTINGSAADKKSVANFVDALSRLSGIANPYLNSTTQGEDAVSFAVNASITNEALCGRFTKSCKVGGN